MGEKPPEMRHLEHEGFVKKLDGIEEAMDKREDAVEDFRMRLVEQFGEFRLELLKEIRAIERSIQMKCENDNLIIATQNREVGRLDRVEGGGTETAKALAVVASSMENLKVDTAKSLKAGHDGIREQSGRIDGHDKRLKGLEARGGKFAIKVLSGASAIAATAGITWWITTLLKRIAERGNP